MKPKAKLIAGLIVVFLAGGVVGSVGTSLFMKGRMEGFKRGGAEKRAERIVSKISPRLDLTEEQEQKVIEILRQDIQQEGPERAERFKARLERRWAMIAEILTDDQKQKLEEHKKRVLERVERRFKN